MYNPDDGNPEWVEFIMSSDSINIKNWFISDVLTTPTKNFITNEDVFITPGEFFIVAKDTSFTLLIRTQMQRYFILTSEVWVIHLMA